MKQLNINKIEIKVDAEKEIRPIHYLGSKLRMLEFIKEAINDLDPEKGRICDLFSGSGTVAGYLSKERSVISVDIQEYSRVLCSALTTSQLEKININEFVDFCKESDHYNNMINVMKELIDYEVNSIELALKGESINLCEIIENGTLLAYELNESRDISFKFRKIIDKVIKGFDDLKYVNNNNNKAMLTRYFGGTYFSYLQAVQLDTLLEGISNLKIKNTDHFKAAILSTASEIVNTVGKQFAQPLKPIDSKGNPKKNIGKQAKKDRDLDVFEIFKKWLNCYLKKNNEGNKSVALRDDYLNALKNLPEDVKVVYADPPYTRYHYSRYYHVLETICLRDNPEISEVKRNGKKGISRGIYRKDRHQSPFSIKSQAEEAFENLFKQVHTKGASLVLSYSPFDKTIDSTPRVQQIEHLKEQAKKYFNIVEVKSVGTFSHSKLNKLDKNLKQSYDAELIIICKN